MKMKITESQLRNLVREALAEFEKPENWNDTEFNGVYTDEDGAVYMPDEDVPEISDEDLLAYADEVDGNPDLMLGRLYRMNESQLVDLIKESIKKTVLNEATIYGKTTYCPADRELGVEWDDSVDNELTELMFGEYEITFTGNAWRRGGDYYHPSEEGIEYVRLYDNGGIDDAINRIKQINPELGAAVENDYKDFFNEASYDADGQYGAIVDWDWERAGDDYYPDYNQDR